MWKLCFLLWCLGFFHVSVESEHLEVASPEGDPGAIETLDVHVPRERAGTGDSGEASSKPVSSRTGSSLGKKLV